MSLKLLFTRQRTLWSRLVCLLTWSSWSHVDIVVERDGKQYVLGSLPSSGVAEKSIASRVDSSSKASLMTIGGVPSGPVIEWARANIGSSYDWPGIVGWLFRKNIADPKKFFCSELVSTAMKEAGSPAFMPGIEWRVTPQMLWELEGFGKCHVERETLK